MAVQHPSPQLRRGNVPLLVGPGGDLLLVDLGGVAPERVAARLAEVAPSGAGVAVHVDDVRTVGERALVSAAALGAIVVVEATGGRPDLPRASALRSAGVPLGQLVVEVGVGPGPVPDAAVRTVAEAGFVAGAVLHRPGSSDTATTTSGRSGDAHAAGWEIGALIALVALGVGTVRGISPQRFRRVLAVLSAIDHAEIDHLDGPVAS